MTTIVTVIVTADDFTDGMNCLVWRNYKLINPTALGALRGQLTFQLAWCREHSAVTVV